MNTSVFRWHQPLHYIAPISYLDLGKRRLKRRYKFTLCAIILTHSLLGLYDSFNRVLRCIALIVYTYSMMTHPSKNFRVLSRYYIHRCWIYYMLFYSLFSSTRFFYLRLFSAIIFVWGHWFTLLPLRFIIVFIPEILATHSV